MLLILGLLFRVTTPCPSYPSWTFEWKLKPVADLGGAI